MKMSIFFLPPLPLTRQPLYAQRIATGQSDGEDRIYACGDRTTANDSLLNPLLTRCTITSSLLCASSFPQQQQQEYRPHSTLQRSLVSHPPVDRRSCYSLFLPLLPQQRRQQRQLLFISLHGRGNEATRRRSLVIRRRHAGS